MDVVVKIDVPALHTDVMKLQAAIKQGMGDLASARSMVEQCPSDDVDTIVNEVRPLLPPLLPTPPPPIPSAPGQGAR